MGASAMPSERWEVVGESYCNTHLRRVFVPETELPCPMFLITIKVVIKRPRIDHQNDGNILFKEENSTVDVNAATVLVRYDNMVIRISQTLSQLQVPHLHTHPSSVSFVQKIVFDTSCAEKDCYSSRPCPAFKVLHMETCIEIYVAVKYVPVLEELLGMKNVMDQVGNRWTNFLIAFEFFDCQWMQLEALTY
ncbi:hypothetical protein D8674_021166 [Pyrus ussuriensis x Pyrus communis]|uniref:Uncharacterized protein n=1 Tax=Pyrus ussuriensis x Pyrus communis TaxID=2448454 RepID=A0A5N5HIU3_9ROSA|nr:hypothetical protein D8674_021166 [Pyrus ussuriensis x Pyrus communis]